ncbi:flagellar hook protein FlgE [Comamonas sp. BIGb0124]|uniref:flagellar hook protein FlgE n=1 Tax=Comamonas sp. BIGb0124 TaxID=2485130 RepID=UPI000F4818E2|nr:flagellar hook protein FlgE [Comamonas sp. BIGb0124]ROR25043.1 flagellar hook protein FlgE [Comamonas sp. BIGb0124]
MSFQQGLSGLNAASRNLDVIGHNIANANTTGMKASRANFSAMYANSIGIVGSNADTGGGLGTTVNSVTQQFTQGNIENTGFALDVAINGSGFYPMSMPDGTRAYTRSGSFNMDSTGNIVTAEGAKLLGYATDAKGQRVTSALAPLNLATSQVVNAKQSTAITAEFTLDAKAEVAATAVPRTPVTTYGTTFKAYDAQGLEVPVGLYFSKTANNQWDVYTSVNGAAPTATGTSVSFDANGTLTAGGSQTLALSSPNGTFNVSLDLSKSKQVNAEFAVVDLQQDGYTTGRMINMTIGQDGVVTASYSNGQTLAAGQIALTNFRNVQGLGVTGNGYWLETQASGQALDGVPGSGSFGVLQAGSLEQANVDLTAELVDMMTAQRAYQANAQTIKTQDQILSTAVNLR